MIGKIANYDTEKGYGKILLEDGSLKSFTIEDWKSFDILPKYGLKVEISDNEIFPIKDSKQDTNENSKYYKQNDQIETKPFKERISPFVQEQIKRGWKLEFEDDKSFTMIKDEDTIKGLTLAFFLFVGLLIASFVAALINPGLSIIPFIVFLVIGFKASSKTVRHTLLGKLIPEENKIYVTIDNQHEGYLTVNGGLYKPREIPKVVLEKFNSNHS